MRGILWVFRDATVVRHSKYKEDAVAYIAGYVVNMVKQCIAHVSWTWSWVRCRSVDPAIFRWSSPKVCGNPPSNFLCSVGQLVGKPLFPTLDSQTWDTSVDAKCIHYRRQRKLLRMLHENTVASLGEVFHRNGCRYTCEQTALKTSSV